jgi:hypothetical protein
VTCGGEAREHDPRGSAGRHAGPLLLYLDQNYLSGIAKRKPAFRELEPVLRDAVDRGVVRVPRARAHHVESEPRPDLGLLALVDQLSCGVVLDELERGSRERGLERRLADLVERRFPERRRRPSDAVDLSALALALPRCRLVTCDAFMADVVHRAGLDVRFRCELFTGRRADIRALRARLESLLAPLGDGTS